MDRMGRHTQQQTSPSVVNGSTKSATGRQHPSPPTFEAPHRAPHRPNPSSVRPTGQLQVVDCRSNAPATPDVTLTLPTPTAVPSCGKSLRPTRSRSSSLESLFSDEKEPASPTQVSLLAPVAREPAPTVPATKPAPTTGPTLTLPSGPATKNPFLPTAGPVAFGAHVPIEAPTPPTPKPAILVARPPPQPQYRWVFAPRGHDAFGLPIPAPPEEVAATFTRAPFALQPLPRGLRLPKAGPAKQLPLGAQSPRSVPTSRLSGGGPPAGHSRSDTPSRVPGATGVTNAGRSTGTRAASSAKPTAPTASESSGEASTPKAPTKARAVAGRSGPKATPKKATQVASGPAVASGANGKGTEPVRVSPSKVEAQNKLIRTKFPGLVMKVRRTGKRDDLSLAWLTDVVFTVLLAA